MKVLFVGNEEQYLAELAKKFDASAFLLTGKNFNTFIQANSNITSYTALSDLPKDTNIFYQILCSANEIHYCPPNHWIDQKKDDNLCYHTDKESGLTELFLLYLSKSKTVHGIDKIYREYPTLDIDSKRKSESPTLWVAGASDTSAVGVTHEQTYGYLLSKSLRMSFVNLAEGGTSNQWSADKILRSDIRPGDIVIWGITQSERITYVNNKELIKFTPPYYERNPGAKKILHPGHLLSKHTLHQSLVSIEQVANFCKKIGVVFFCFLTLPTADHRLYRFLFSKDYFMHIDFNFIIDKKTGAWDIQRIDYGTDNIHPGPKHHRYWHDSIIQFIA